MLRLADHPTSSAVIGTVLALVAVAAAIIIAAVYPALNTLVVALTLGLLIGALALVATIAFAALYRLRLPSNSDAWVFW